MTIDLISNKALEVVNALQNALMTHGGEAVQLGLNAVRIDCIRNMIFYFGGVIFAYILLCLVKKYDLKKDDEKTEACIVFCVALIVILISIFSIIDIWHWIGIFDPKLYLAHQVIGKVVG